VTDFCVLRVIAGLSFGAGCAKGTSRAARNAKWIMWPGGVVLPALELAFVAQPLLLPSHLLPQSLHSILELRRLLRR
jgi:hypothetical protein